ncbi:ParB N-terminal domain-containing protein [Robbsia sp. Bb-Pol-6]|uniref:ParB N-terminal domain-containing protein n=1 Tax=Robbsia betulipollinis TaxID=2981849 RepID=A0ABT3ZUK1_9BURK|nr:ParB N-terminal domain-containing protein [Robbsia betulipollinis]MCY0389895.1 ParB N-terminal domain-containing protein [Robbsia betulipollinis]
MSNRIQDRLLAKTSGLLSKEREEASVTIPTRPKGSSMPAQLGAFRQDAQRYLTRIEELQKQLALANDAAGILSVPLERIRVVEGRRKFMSSEKFAELRENLRHNRLMHPIVVSKTDDGFYELISGHHRFDAYKEIGFESIRATVDTQANDQNDTYVGAFYANLFQSDLTDFEKFVGFEEIRRIFPDMSQSAISEQSGIDQSTLSRLMSFKQLPQVALAHLKNQPSLIGSNTAAKLAMLVRAGREAPVLDALELLANGKVDQKKALALASRKPRSEGSTEKALVDSVKQGRAVLFNVRSAGNSIRIELKTDSDIRKVHEAILRTLSEVANDVTKD